MDAFWLLTGLLSICMPHFAAAGTGVAWSCTPYAPECSLILIILALASTREASRVARLLPPASMATTFVTLLFEAICIVAIQDMPVPDMLVIAEMLLHGGSVALWLAATILRSSDTDEVPEQNARLANPALVVSVTAALSGAMWFILSSAAIERSAMHLSFAVIEPTLWLSTAIWAMPLLLLIHSLDVDRKTYAAICAGPFVGILFANRIWQVINLVGLLPYFSINPGILLALPALFSAGTYLIAWLGRADESGDTPPKESVSNTGQPTLPASKLPIYRLPGYSLLTDREREVVDASIAGATTERIAEALSLAPGTVSTYRSRAYSKLGVSSTQELLSVACELLLQPRVFIEPDEKPDNESKNAQEDRNSSLKTLLLKTLPERLIPPFFCAACAIAILIIVCLVRLIPYTYGPTLALCISGMALLICSTLLSPLSENANEQLTALYIGSAIGIALATVLLGPVIYFAARLIIVGAVCAAAAWLMWSSRGLWSQIVVESVGYCGLIFITMAPKDTIGQSLTRTPVLFLVSALLLLAASYTTKRAHDNEASQIASTVLEGDERLQAYLLGRGLPDLQAKVLVLTARGFAQSSIASNLCISRSTVKEYRARAYRILGIKSKEQLVELLTAEAGL